MLFLLLLLPVALSSRLKHRLREQGEPTSFPYNSQTMFSSGARSQAYKSAYDQQHQVTRMDAQGAKYISEQLLDSIEYPKASPDLQLSSVALLSKDVGKYAGMVIAGGAKGLFALSRLNTIADTQAGKALVWSKLKGKCMIPLLDAEQDMKVRIGCASILNKISNTPVTTQEVDTNTGEAYGLESFVVAPDPARLYRPDYEIMKLRAGADYIHTLDGAFFVNQHSFSALNNYAFLK